MDKENLLKILIKALKAGTLISTGAGAFLLFSPNKERTVEIAKFEDSGVIVKKTWADSGAWNFVKEHPESSFYMICSGSSGEDTNNKNCHRYLKSKYQEYPIHLYLEKQTGENTNNGLGYYKFTYSGTENLGGENKKEYVGECWVDNVSNNEKINEELKKTVNPCNEINIPDKWSRGEKL